MKSVFQFLMICCIFSVSSGLAQTPNPTPDAEKLKNDPEYRKKWEEYEKKLAEVHAKNKQIAETNAKMKSLLDEGNNAFQKKNYQLAIKKYDEAIALDDYWGMLTVILNNRAIALKMLGVESYNNPSKKTFENAKTANPYFIEAINSLNRTLKSLAEIENSIDESLKERAKEIHFIAVKQLADCYRLLTLSETSKIPEAIKAFEEYIRIEKDETLRKKATIELERLKKQSEPFRISE